MWNQNKIWLAEAKHVPSESHGFWLGEWKHVPITTSLFTNYKVGVFIVKKKILEF